MSYRQLDYWDRIGLVSPSIRGANGSGTQRAYSEHDAQLVSAVAFLIGHGVTLGWIRRAIEADRLIPELRAMAARLSTLAEALDHSAREAS